MKEAVVPKEERKPNKVDKLLEEIEKIRKKCRHDYRLLGPVALKESKEEGIFILGDTTWDPNHPEEYINVFQISCLKCSEKKTELITEICPRCLGKLKKCGLSPDRTRYFGKECLFYAVRFFECPHCGFKGVADEWCR